MTSRSTSHEDPATIRMVEDFEMRSGVWKRVFLQILGPNAESQDTPDVNPCSVSRSKCHLSQLSPASRSIQTDLGSFAFLSLFLTGENNGRIGDSVAFVSVLRVIIGGYYNSNKVEPLIVMEAGKDADSSEQTFHCICDRMNLGVEPPRSLIVGPPTRMLVKDAAISPE